MARFGKRTTAAREGIDRKAVYNITEAVEMLKASAKKNNNVNELACD